MASHITHIVLAEKILEKIPDKFNKGEFLIGTILPDIQYLKIIGRDKTHFHKLSFKDILNEQNSFMAGFKYHSLVDEIRENYMVEKNIYSLLPSSKIITQALKAYEDELLYIKIEDRDQIIKYLDKILPEEKTWVEQVDKIKEWHSLIQKYFLDGPTDTSRKNFILGIGLSEEIESEIDKLICEMKETPKIKEIVLGLYDDWDSLVDKTLKATHD